MEDGLGIEAPLLSEALFEHFRTTKNGGSGVGLRQVKTRISKMKGTIHAENVPSNDAKFTIQRPSPNTVEKIYKLIRE